jgi:hypothetical protein|tara:strand:- start:5240 stop:5413 length:174 start_codon:yes stop_codon:yes gene_type:complete
MAIKKYSHGDHMAQLGRVTGLLEAQNKIQEEIIKEQKKLRVMEHRQLLEKIKGNEKK